MNLLRTLALLALVGAVPLTARATTLGSNPVVATVPPPFGPATPESAPLDASTSGTISPETTSVLASGPVPIGDSRWAYRTFSVTAEGLRQPEEVAAVEEAPSPTPEPAGLFLLGTGAFVTALSIRYRLFAL